MTPNAWTAFVFFGIPLALGLLGLLHSSRLFYRSYHRQTGGVEFDQVSERTPEDSTSRNQLLQYGALFVVSALLVAHSGRWLLRIYGFL